MPTESETVQSNQPVDKQEPGYAEEPGQLDIAVDALAAINALQACMKRLYEASDSFALRTAQGTELLAESQTSNNLMAMREAINEQACNMQDYAQTIRTESPQLLSSADTSLEMVEKLFLLFLVGELKAKDFKPTIDGFEGLVLSLKSIQPGLAGLNEIVQRFPRYTSSVAASKRILTEQLQTFGANLTIYTARAESFIDGTRDSRSLEGVLDNRDRVP